MEQKIKKRDYGIDLLKVISTFAVLAVHSQRCSETGELFNPFLYYIARFAMPCFFMCNGFLIMKRETFDFKYYIKKITNIVRVLLIWSCVTIVLSLLIEHNTLKVALIDGIKCGLGAKIVPFWFLFTLGIIYTALIFLFDWVKRNINVLLIVLLVGMFIIHLFSLINIFRGGYFIQQIIDQRFRLWTWVFYFLSGYKIKLFMQERAAFNKNKLFLLTTFMTVIVFFYQYYLCAIYLNKINSEYLYDSIFIVIWCVLIFVLFNSIEIHDDRKIICFLSSNTFGIFLLHGYFLYYLKLTNRIHGFIDSTLLWIALIIICYVITAIVRKIPIGRKIFEY